MMKQAQLTVTDNEGLFADAHLELNYFNLIREFITNKYNIN